MTKLDAVKRLLKGECDLIVHGKSEFMVRGTSIVNKKSKRPLDMKKLTEEGWELKNIPRWYDKVLSGEMKYVLVKHKDIPLILDASDIEALLAENRIEEYTPMMHNNVKPYIAVDSKYFKKINQIRGSQGIDEVDADDIEGLPRDILEGL